MADLRRDRPLGYVFSSITTNTAGRQMLTTISIAAPRELVGGVFDHLLDIYL